VLFSTRTKEEIREPDQRNANQEKLSDPGPVRVRFCSEHGSSRAWRTKVVGDKLDSKHAYLSTPKRMGHRKTRASSPPGAPTRATRFVELDCAI
jgi:hypothetical protein